jgi:hypothetical protein
MLLTHSASAAQHSWKVPKEPAVMSKCLDFSFTYTAEYVVFHCEKNDGFLQNNVSFKMFLSIDGYSEVINDFAAKIA